ncbi:hypothetical protein HPB47_002724 [Ixodes persulcatus]|uniref:Uncharacterized protein n=1 Tax=Ixodes persulcatus TaxID=34615 RepID=A0AC60PKM0_IXOPE|nr:hypothetical protein HPB47_002724 [Ixodes persulcatus]
MSQLEAEIAYIGMCLRIKYIDLIASGLLASMQVGWHHKRKVRMITGTASRNNFRTMNHLSDDLWTALLECYKILAREFPSEDATSFVLCSVSESTLNRDKIPHLSQSNDFK